MAINTSKNNNGVVTVVLSRQSALNALNIETLESLGRTIQECYQNSEVKGLIITGDGDKAFVAGADIRELASLSKDEALKLAQKGHQLFKSIENCAKPVIAAINGFALGGGCELAMACHMRIATENARFGQPEVNLGIIPGYGGTQRFAQLLGRGKALELLMTGDMISAQEAKTLGLVNHVVANREELMVLSEKIMSKIIAKGPVAIANVIKAVNAGFVSEELGYETEAKLFAECATTQDFKEGTSAFLEKRQPAFKGN